MINSRWRKRFETNLTTRFGLESFTGSGKVQNVSQSGFFIRTSEVFPNETLLNIQILTPHKERITMTGMVQWGVKNRLHLPWFVKSKGMGIKIKSILEGQESYAKHLSQLSKRRTSHPCATEVKSSNFVSRFFSGAQ